METTNQKHPQKARERSKTDQEPSYSQDVR